METKGLFPIISNCRQGLVVLWEDAEKAFATYSKRFPGDTMELLVQQGGFGVEEFVYFYHGFFGPEEGAWPTDVCQDCQGSGMACERSGLVDLCRKCLGAGALLPKEHPGTMI